MKRIISTFLTIATLTCIAAAPVQAARKITAKTVEISTKDHGYARSYASYDTKEEADTYPIIFYANKNELPIRVAISAFDGSRREYSFDSYGVKRVDDHCVPLFSFSGYDTYATIDIEPYPATTVDCVQKEPAQDEVIDKKLVQLLEELELGLTNDESTPYGKELRRFLTGEWDGGWIKADSEEAYANYVASREVRARTYRWDGVNLLTGETSTKEVNIDYVGKLEVVPGPTASQAFSFAVNRTSKTLEQWSLLEKIDSWELPKDVGTIQKVYPIGQNSGNPDECQALVYAFDTDKQLRGYMLYPGGIVK